MPDKSIRDMTPKELADWYADVIDSWGIEGLKRLAKERKASGMRGSVPSVGKRD